MTPLVRETREILKGLGVPARKSFGQNFMVNEDVLSFIARSVCLEKGGTVLEIGPGLGFLTRHLLSQGAQVIAVEKDAAFAGYLNKNYNRDSFRLVRSDILKMDIQKDLDIHAPVKVVGNIPYNITSPVLEWLITHKIFISEAVLTVQKEVAERLTARPGNKTWGSLSVFVQFHSQVCCLKIISRGNFYPAPSVDSAVVKLVFPEKPIYPVQDEKVFSSLVRRAFQKRRKTILNALADEKDVRFTKNQLAETFRKVGINPTRRPETLSIPEWVGLADALG